MIKTLTRHGDSYALVIDKAILELLSISPDTPLEVATDGHSLTITPVTEAMRLARLQNALEETNRVYGRALKKLAE